MIRFQCPHCRGIIAAGEWEPAASTECAYCSKEVYMPQERICPGVVIGDFLLVRKLGAGGMGIVFLAHQLSLDRPAAIKILNSEYSQETESVQAFIREARSAAKINHPNIVQAYAVGEEDGIFYFAMEFLDGNTMKEELQNLGKIDPLRAANVIMQVAEALDCAWEEQKIIHHDIKPDNIMQCANERVKLADLGLAGTFGSDANDESDEVIGTPQYISPEQLTGVVTDTRSDIYSLGATFYHLVTGQFPYNGENTDEIAKQHVFGTLIPPRNINPQLPQQLNDIIVKMMAKSPEGRFQSCADLVKALKNFINNDARQPAASGGLSGLSLASSAGSSSSLKLSGSGAGVQPKIAVPANPIKLSIKKSDDSSAANAPVTENSSGKVQQESASAPAATADNQAVLPPENPEVKAANNAPAAPAVPKITLLKSGTKSPLPAAPSATAEPVPTQPPVPAEKAPSKDPAEAVPAEIQNPSGEKSPVNSDKSGAADSVAIEDEKKDPAVDSAEDKLSEKDSEAEKSGKSRKNRKMLLSVLIALIVLLIAGGGAFAYFQYFPQPAEPKTVSTVPEDNMTIAERMVAAGKEAAVQAAVTVKDTSTDTYNISEPATPVLPELSDFMRKAKKLEELSFSNERSFVQRFAAEYSMLHPGNAEERQFMQTILNVYIDADERLNVTPDRKRLLDQYNQTVASQARQAAVAAELERIKNAELAALARGDASAENYRKDLARKMSVLDHAMITAAKSGKEEDFERFKKVLVLAWAEPKRVADREGFAEPARELADYARKLKVVAEQGYAFSEILKKKALNGSSINILNGSVSVEASDASSITLYVAMENADGKTVRLDLLNGPVVENKKWISVIEPLISRSDQYFYYMLFNGHLRNRLAGIAPDDFWRKRVDRIVRGYFKREIFLADPVKRKVLEQQYGDWPSFKNALKEYEAEN